MIIVTPEAAKQIRQAAEQSFTQGLPLRIAVTRSADGMFHYRMGFDDEFQVGDISVETEGINLLVDADSQALCQGMMLDFVELDGNMEFVFMNPNDPHYRPPQD
ncbi:HesB/IscA family protein [Thiolinea disciformis]|uniref:HesB/IscA family protein n=1 Tax=Thiolinea disciformis TaxID=125614 RepID=UPI00036DE170|nr:iron-sulfur cluster assembly accessory protein [Thiolinea disciformis]